jgi:ABC-type branched-subunit amino acid transport system ATPase component
VTLEIEAATVERDGVAMVHGVSLSMTRGQVTAVLGANGAGKSELLLGVAGVLSVPSGLVRVRNTVLTGLPSVTGHMALPFDATLPPREPEWLHSSLIGGL